MRSSIKCWWKPVSTLLLILFLTSCSDGDSDSDEPKPVTRVEISPYSVMLPAQGDTYTLTARAYNADGVQVHEQVTWSSNDPETVSVDENGLLTAVTSVGSAIITAEVAGIQSAPATVLVVTVAPKAQLIVDSQVVGNFEALDPTALMLPGALYNVTLTGIDPPAVGTILLGTEEAPVGGEVVAVEVVGGNVVVTLELLPLDELFSELVIDEIYDLSDVVPEVPDAVAEYYGMTRLEDGSYEFTLKEGAPEVVEGVVSPESLTTASKEGSIGSLTEVSFGPFDCKTLSPTVPLRINIPVKPRLEQDLKFILSYHDLDETNFMKAAMEGSVAFVTEFEPSIDIAVQAKVECQAWVGTLTVPIGGVVAYFFGAQIPMGFGFELEGKATAAQFGADIKGRVGTEVSLGVECPAGDGDCEMLNTIDLINEIDIEPVFPDPDNLTSQLQVEAGAFGFAYAELALGSSFWKSVNLELFEVKLGLATAYDLAPVNAQVLDTGYASGYTAGIKGEAGLGDHAQDFFDFLRIAVTPLKVEKDLVLFESPKALAVTVDWETYEAGDTLRFNVHLDSDTLAYPPSLYNVDTLTIYQKDPSSTLGVVTIAQAVAEEFRDELEFEMTWEADEDGDATDNFYAFVETPLLPLPILGELELLKAEILDSDEDNMADGWERKYGLSRSHNNGQEDFDNDDLNDYDEYLNDTIPNDDDTDDDKMPDGWEVEFLLDPKTDDAANHNDGDTLTNLEEFENETDPNKSDTDDDLIPDDWEVTFNTDPTVDDASISGDSDTLTNLEEYNNGTDPNNPDTDGDQLPDDWEVLYGFDPVITDNAPDDPDSDGATNLEEFLAGTDPIEGLPDTAPAAINLNDTGTARCYSDLDDDGGTCPVLDYPDQDAETGRDSYGDKLVRTGVGPAGFDFTKLDVNGEPLPDQTVAFTTQSWDCAHDNVTGLTWEVKQGDGEDSTSAAAAGIRYWQNDWSWYDSNSTTNGGLAGTSDGGYCYDVDDVGSCAIRGDTEAYTNAINSMALCGYTDWRLPSLNEALSISDVEGLSGLNTIFPFSSATWTATPYIWQEDDGTFHSEEVFSVGSSIYTDSRTDHLGGSFDVNPIRLVRGERW
jgi:hypothetical protein